MAGEVRQILEYAIGNGFLTKEQVEECAKIQNAVNEAGLPKTLIQVLFEKNYLSREQLNQIKVKLDLPIAEIGNYGILSKLGAGGMGTVYKARRLSDGKTVAVKLLSQRVKDKEHIERFQREIAAGVELRHPNIVSVIDSGVEKNNYFYVMEYIEGKDLDKIIEKDGAMPEPEAVGLITQVVDALAHAHKKGIVHRDIKPANIIISDDGIPKLCDFGIAKFTSDGYSALTQTGVSLSTPQYASPEQARGEKDIDIRSDLYSLGVTLYHMVIGRVPFEGENTTAILSKHINEIPQHPKKLNPKVSNWLANVILKLMQKIPSQRYQTPADLMIALKNAGHKPQAEEDTRKYLIKKAAYPPKKLPIKSASKVNPVITIIGSVILVAFVLSAIYLATMEHPTISSSAQAYYYNGYDRYNLGDYTGAIEYCDKALDQNINYAEAYNLRGRARWEQFGDSENAIDDFNKAIELNPKLAPAYGNRGIVKNGIRDYKGAIEDWEKAISLEPFYKDQLQPKIDEATARIGK